MFFKMCMSGSGDHDAPRRAFAARGPHAATARPPSRVNHQKGRYTLSPGRHAGEVCTPRTGLEQSARWPLPCRAPAPEVRGSTVQPVPSREVGRYVAAVEDHRAWDRPLDPGTAVVEDVGPEGGHGVPAWHPCHRAAALGDPVPERGHRARDRPRGHRAAAVGDGDPERGHGAPVSHLGPPAAALRGDGVPDRHLGRRAVAVEDAWPGGVRGVPDRHPCHRA